MRYVIEHVLLQRALTLIVSAAHPNASYEVVNNTVREIQSLQPIVEPAEPAAAADRPTVAPAAEIKPLTFAERKAARAARKAKR